MEVSEFPSSTMSIGRPINPADDVLQLLPFSQAQSYVSILDMMDIHRLKKFKLKSALCFCTF